MNGRDGSLRGAAVGGEMAQVPRAGHQLQRHHRLSGAFQGWDTERYTDEAWQPELGKGHRGHFSWRVRRARGPT